MKITVLGSGTSTGVPMLGCSCRVCTSADPRNKRSRSSIWVQSDKISMVIDTATEFRLQALECGLTKLDAILLTHAHADHLHGLDDVRPLSLKKPIPLFGTEATLNEVQIRFPYIFKETIQLGGGKPQIRLEPIDRKPFILGDLEITPLPVYHGKLDIRGYKINNLAYITDCSAVSASTFQLIKGVDTLILGALRYRAHATHFNIEEAVELIKKARPRKALLTHFSHDIDHEELEKSLSADIKPCYDGLTWEIN